MVGPVITGLVSGYLKGKFSSGAMEKSRTFRQ